MAQWLSWLERRPVTAEVVSSSLIWVACEEDKEKIFKLVWKFLNLSDEQFSTEYEAAKQQEYGVENQISRATKLRRNLEATS